MKRKVTIRDVARYSGVSVATVSNVINNINKTSEETKRKILKDIEDIGYQPDFTARCLAKGKSNLIGVMFPITEKGDEPGILLRNNPFFSEFVSGVEYAARARDYDILIAGIQKGQRCEEWIDKRNLDGIILLGLYPQTFFNEMSELQLPVVITDIYEQYARMFHRVTVDDERGGYIAANHLISLGHRNIVLATGRISSSGVNSKRFKGYKKALREAGIKIDKRLIMEDHVTFDGGYEIGKKILKVDADVTAVFAVADIVAFGIVKALKDNGKRVPADYSIVGFDDIKMCEYMSPGLTTVRQDIFGKGKIVAEAIIDDIEYGITSDESILLPVELIIRESTAYLI